ncbi:MAG: SUMF1/EgtB/PvdO family nonheme iron enzyme [Deltaproteobacteria bacterium]|nr:SUMF1/EgtB/PvdO family nonheme iron enzyme [Deltaproteobacteria bacterium]
MRPGLNLSCLAIVAAVACGTSPKGRPRREAGLAAPEDPPGPIPASLRKIAVVVGRGQGVDASETRGLTVKLAVEARRRNVAEIQVLEDTSVLPGEDDPFFVDCVRVDACLEGLGASLKLEGLALVVLLSSDRSRLVRVALLEEGRVRRADELVASANLTGVTDGAARALSQLVLRPEGKRPKRTVPAPATEMVRVPAGEFFMGCNEELDRECPSNERPGRKVTVDAFRIDKVEVTVGAFGACARAGVCQAARGAQGEATHPVVGVDWTQADAYCRWSGRRLPTEAEWEKAARGTDARIFPWGDVLAAQRANLAGEEDGFVRTAPVGSFPLGSSQYGALDMSGNVMEWTSDWLGESGSNRAARGGGWTSKGPDARASSRSGFEPSFHHVYLGFRCAQSGDR